MFLKYFEQSEMIANTLQKNIIPGTRAYRFAVSPSENLPPITQEEESVLREVLFCLNGGFTIQKKNSRPHIIQKGDIFTLQGKQKEVALRFPEKVEGILVVFQETTEEIKANQLFLFSQRKADEMQQNELFLLRDCIWNQAAFMALENMNEESCMIYCIWKAMELQFLIQNSIVSKKPKYEYMTVQMSRICQYMQKHLDEKLTISHISQKFHLSPTTLKTTFHRFYGQPIHQWLQTQRMERAAELLYTTSKSILQIAQDVGYEGLSQFNAVFKKKYGMTPRQYRKMSDTGEN